MNLLHTLIDYLKGSRFEMRQVTWPTREQTIRYTVLVIALSVAVAAFLGLLDFIFTSLLERLL